MRFWRKLLLQKSTADLAVMATKKAKNALEVQFATERSRSTPFVSRAREIATLSPASETC